MSLLDFNDGNTIKNRIYESPASSLSSGLLLLDDLEEIALPLVRKRDSKPDTNSDIRDYTRCFEDKLSTVFTFNSLIYFLAFQRVHDKPRF